MEPRIKFADRLVHAKDLGDADGRTPGKTPDLSQLSSVRQLGLLQLKVAYLQGFVVGHRELQQQQPQQRSLRGRTLVQGSQAAVRSRSSSPSSAGQMAAATGQQATFTRNPTVSPDVNERNEVLFLIGYTEEMMRRLMA